MKKTYIFTLSVLFLIICQNLRAVTYFYQGGTINTLANWNTLANGTGTAPTAFSGVDVWNFHGNSPATFNGINWGLAATATINVGDGTAAFNMIISGGYTLGAVQPRINFNNASTLTLNAADVFNNSATKTVFNSGSTVIYGTGANTVITTSYVDNYHHLIVSIAESLNGGALDVDGTLTLNNTLDMVAGAVNASDCVLNSSLTFGGGALTLSGTMSGTANLVTDNLGSSITLNGSSNVGTLNFASPFNLSNITLSLSGASTSVTLGTNLNIDGGALTLTSGAMDLNGKFLTVAAAGSADFSGTGTFIGSNTSAIRINATAATSGLLKMNTTNQNLGGLTINSPSNTISMGSVLNIIDSISVVSGTFASNSNVVSLVADASRAGRIARVGTNGGFSGNIKVQAFFSSSGGTGSPGWAIIGANGVSSQSIGSLDGQIAIACQGCTYGVTASGNYFESVQGWKESACHFDTTLTSSTPLTTGKGFWVYLSTGLNSTNDMSWAFTGPVVKGNVSISCSLTSGSCSGSTLTGVTDGSNLVANPYACPISWDNVYNLGSNSSNFGSSIWYRQRNTSSVLDYNATLMSGSGTGNIPAGQGFEVLCSFNGSTLDFAESVKTTSNTVLMLRPSADAPPPPPIMHLKIAGTFDNDISTFAIHPKAGPGYDNYDTHKRFTSPGYGGSSTSYSKYTSISSWEPAVGKYLSINTCPPADVTRTVPVLARVSTTGSYTITAQDFENYPSCIVLRDKLSNVYTDLKLKPYVFNIEDSTSAPRFELIICESGGGVISLNELYASENISIAKDHAGPIVKTHFDMPTDAVISVYNIIGQKLTNDIVVNGTTTTTHINNLNVRNQVVIIKVTANDRSVSKKLMVE